MAKYQKIQLLRTNKLNNKPKVDDLYYGELALNYNEATPCLSFKDTKADASGNIDSTYVSKLQEIYPIINTVDENSVQPVSSSAITEYLKSYQKNVSNGNGIDITNNVVSTKLGEFLDYSSDGSITLDIDNELNSGSNKPVSNSAITKTILDNEKVTAAAINDLDERVESISGDVSLKAYSVDVYNKEEVDEKLKQTQNLNSGNGISIVDSYISTKLGSYLTFDSNSAITIDMDKELNSGSNKPVSNSAITSTIIEDEEIIAGALADLNERVSTISGTIETKANSSDVYTKEETYTKDEVDSLIPDDYLPLSGGTLTGPLTVQGEVTASGAIYSSDYNLKENINPVSPEALDKISGVQLKEFNFIADKKKRIRYGVIAQDLEDKGLDNLVVIDETGTKGVDYISLLILKIQQLENELEELKSK